MKKLTRDDTEHGPAYYLASDVDAEMARLHEANAELLAAITKTVKKNLHLADGENCTLIDLVQVLEKHGVTV